MQVFLPERTFSECAESLDTKRLVKQLLEGRQIMTILAGESPSGAWRNHPAVKMFKGSERTLFAYLYAIKEEMNERGYKWELNWSHIYDTYLRNFINQKQDTPSWMLNSEFDKVIVTHRGRLYEKAPELYPQYKKEYNIYKDYVCCDTCTYYWVTHNSMVK